MDKTILYRRLTDGTIKSIEGRKPWGVDIPNYVYDLWAPLIGTHVIGVYGQLKRLGRKQGNGNFQMYMNLRVLAAHCGIAFDTLRKYCQILSDFRFIQMRTPNEKDRRLGNSTIFQILVPPTQVTPKDIQYAKDKGWAPKTKDWIYDPLVYWFIADDSQPAEAMQWNETGYTPEIDTHEIEPVGDQVEMSTSQSDLLDDQVEMSTFNDPFSDPYDLKKPLSPDGEFSFLDKDCAGAPLAEPPVPSAQIVDDEKNDSRGNERIKYDDPRMPMIGNRILGLLGKHEGKTFSSMKAEQVEKLLQSVMLRNGQQRPSPQELFTKAQTDVYFKRWLDTLPAILKNHNKHVTINNLITYVRFYDMKKHGFYDWVTENYGYDMAEWCGAGDLSPRRSTNTYEAKKGFVE